MKRVYPVLLTKTDTVVLVEVPDLEILTEGKNLSDAIDMAKDAIELKCVSLEDDGLEIPRASESLDVNEGTFSDEGNTILTLVNADPSEYRRKIDTKTVRRNVALPSWLNYEAEHAGINVSRVLQEALINVLGLQRNM